MTMKTTAKKSAILSATAAINMALTDAREKVPPLATRDLARGYATAIRKVGKVAPSTPVKTDQGWVVGLNHGSILSMKSF